MVLNGAMNMNTRTAVPDGMLRPYDNQMTFYAAASINMGDYQRTFIIGDGQSYTRNNVEFMNSPLRADQQYVFFVRLYSSNPVSYMYNEEGGRKRKGERGVRREEERKEEREWREGGREGEG